MPPFLPFADQAMYLAHAAGGQHAVIQLLWRYRRTVDLAALSRTSANLAHGPLARLVRPALLPFGRHHWSAAPPPPNDVAIAAGPLPLSLLQDWADAQVDLPLDPAQGPPWRFTAQRFADGSTVVSLVVSHCIADGMATAHAVSDAARGERRPPGHPGPQGAAALLAAEMLRSIKDAPATLKALTALARRVRTQHAHARKTATEPSSAETDRRGVAFPSAFLRVPADAWDARARKLGSNRFTLLVAVTAAFALALGRQRGGEVTLLIPVNQREGRADTGANRVSLATLKLAASELDGPLRALQRRLQSTLVEMRRTPDPVESLLPLVPFVPRRAFAAAGQLALGALADLPVTCSHMGDLPRDLLRIDGADADRFCFRGVDRGARAQALEQRQGVATLLAGVIPGMILLNFVAYQPGVITCTPDLRGLVEGLLARFELVGAGFDD